MGQPWIKQTKVSDEELSRISKMFSKVRWDSDAISFEDWLYMIVDRINDAEEAKEKAQKKVKQYEESISADARVQELSTSLQAARSDLYRGFGISEEEDKAINEWKEKHDAEQHGLDNFQKRLNAGGAIGGRFKYVFYPTSIGVIGECVCGNCERKALEESAGNRKKYTKLLEKYNATFQFQDL